jgi:short-subunit dehydrogenase
MLAKLQIQVEYAVILAARNKAWLKEVPKMEITEEEEIKVVNIDLESILNDQEALIRRTWARRTAATMTMLPSKISY